MKDNSKLIKPGTTIKLISFNTLLKNTELIPISSSVFKLDNGRMVMIAEKEKEAWNSHKTITKKRIYFGKMCVEQISKESFTWIYPISWILKTIK